MGHLLLKRIQECISNGYNWIDSCSNSLYKLDNTDLAHAIANQSDRSSSPSAIERLPLDVFIQILKLLEPKEAARLTCVYKCFKEIVSDDKLWEYYLRNQLQDTLFAETNLRYGFPLRRCPERELSFKHVYGERAKVPPALIIDVSGDYCKIGWSNHDIIHMLTSVEFGNINGVEVWLNDFYRRMNVDPSKRPVIISTPIKDDGAFRHISTDVLCSRLFKNGVPAVCHVKQATLALFSARRTSGILVNIGFHQTSVVPIVDGEIRYKVGVESLRLGCAALLKYLRQQLNQRNLHVPSSPTVYLLKEKLCYVALDYEAELLKDTEASCEVDSCGCFTLKQERFRTPELLFQPQIAGINERGLHEAVAKCIHHCGEVKMKSGHDWFKTIVLVGDSACLPGLAERLEKELHHLLPPSISNGIHVTASPYGGHAAWRGAKLVSNLSTFIESWCIKRPPPQLTIPKPTVMFLYLCMASCFFYFSQEDKVVLKTHFTM